MNRIFSEISKYIVSLIMMMLILLTAVSLFIKLTLLNESYYKRVFGSEVYISRVMGDLKENMQVFAVTNAVSYEIVEKNLNEALVKEQIDNNMSSILSFLKSNDETYKSAGNIDELNKFKESMAKDIKEKYPYAKDAEIKSAVTEAVRVIDNNCSFFDFSRVSSAGAVKSVRRVFNMVDKLYFTPVLLFMVVIFLFLFKSRGYELGERLLWTGSGILAAALILVIPSAMLLAFKIPDRLAVDIEHVNYAVKTFLTFFGEFFLIFGVVMTVAGIILMGMRFHRKLSPGLS
ncbi:MAG: hypothetical protein ABRQ27_01190 [Clostridiaceae bacterium]